MRWRHFAKDFLSVYLFYLGIAIVITLPLINHLDDALAGGFLTDAYQISRHSWSIKHALQNGQSPFDQSLMAYPDGMGGALIWANPFQFFPVWLFAFIMPLSMAYNITLLLRLAMNGWAMFFLVRHLSKGNVYASLVAGVVFLTYPAVQGRIYGGHLGVLFLWAMPLYLYCIYQLRDMPRRYHIGLAALFCTIAPLGNTSMLIFYVVPIITVLFLYQIFTRQWQWFKHSLFATIIGMAGVLIFLVPLMLENTNNPQFDTNIGGVVRYSADSLSLVTPSFEHPIYGELAYTHEVLGINLVEGLAYIGIIPLLLAIWSLIHQPQSRWLLSLMLGAWILSLGPLLKYQDELVLAHFTSLEGETWETYISLPLAWAQNLPILDQSRTPGRFTFTIGFSVAILAGYGLTDLAERVKATHWRMLATGVLVVLVIADYQSFWSMPYADGTIPQGVTDLKDEDDIRAVFNVPWNDRILTKVGIYYQSAHEKPIITGQFVRDTPASHAKLTLMQNTLDASLLYANGVDMVLVHEPTSQVQYYEQALTNFGEPIYRDYRVAIFRVPNTGTPPEFMSISPTDTTLERNLSTYLYAPSAGWTLFSGKITDDIADIERELVLYVEDEPIHHWSITNDIDLEIAVPLYLPDDGFYDVKLALEPECPYLINPTVQCRSFEATNLQVDQFISQNTRTDAIEFERGLSLNYNFVKGDEEHMPQVWLDWGFEEVLTENDVRFVHIVNEQGELVHQFDDVLSVDYVTMENWSEALTLDFAADLADGTYTIYAGWYTYPELNRFTISSGQHANNLVHIGDFSVPSTATTPKLNVFSFPLGK